MTMICLSLGKELLEKIMALKSRNGNVGLQLDVLHFNHSGGLVLPKSSFLGNMAYIKGIFKLKIRLYIIQFHVFIYFKGEVCIVTLGELENIFNLHYLILFSYFCYCK